MKMGRVQVQGASLPCSLTLLPAGGGRRSGSGAGSCRESCGTRERPVLRTGARRCVL